MNSDLLRNQDPVANPVLPSDGLPKDTAPTTDTPTGSPADEPTEPTPEASGPPVANSDSSNPKHPTDPSRDGKLLKADRTGIGGPKTPAGKAKSSLNNLQHGCYSKLPFYLLPWETQDEFDRLAAGFRAAHEPFDAVTSQILELCIQAAWRIGRCNYVDTLAMEPAEDIDKYLRRLASAASLRSACERSFYQHLNKLQKMLQEHHQSQEAENEALRNAASKRYNEKGEEMDPRFPQRVIKKSSCDPDSICNEVLEFDCTLAGHHTVTRTALKDWEGGRLMGPEYKPAGMTEDWPDYLLGPWAKNPEKK